MDFEYIYETAKSFVLAYGPKILAVLFNLDYIPVFFIIQSLYVCLEVRLNAKKLTWSQSLILSTLMVHLGRIVTAFICYRQNPLMQNPLCFPVLIVIWFFVNASPFDIVYKIFNFTPIFAILQVFYTLLQTRQIVNGISLAEIQYSKSLSGIILVSTVLSSTSSLIFIVMKHKARDFSSSVFIRNAFDAAILVLHKHFRAEFDKVIKISEESLQVVILCLNVLITITNDICYGLKGNDSIGDKLLVGFPGLFSYHGAEVAKKKNE